MEIGLAYCVHCVAGRFGGLLATVDVLVGACSGEEDDGGIEEWLEELMREG